MGRVQTHQRYRTARKNRTRRRRIGSPPSNKSERFQRESDDRRPHTEWSWEGVRAGFCTRTKIDARRKLRDGSPAGYHRPRQAATRCTDCWAFESNFPSRVTELPRTYSPVYVQSEVLPDSPARERMIVVSFCCASVWKCMYTRILTLNRSMTGAPKLRSTEILERLEGGPRGIYSGCLGFISLSGSSDMSVVIRTAVCTQNSVSIGTCTNADQ